MGRMAVTWVNGLPVRVKSPIVITDTSSGGRMATSTARQRRSAVHRRPLISRKASVRYRPLSRMVWRLSASYSTPIPA